MARRGRGSPGPGERTFPLRPGRCLPLQQGCPRSQQRWRRIAANPASSRRSARARALLHAIDMRRGLGWACTRASLIALGSVMLGALPAAASSALLIASRAYRVSHPAGISRAEPPVAPDRTRSTVPWTTRIRDGSRSERVEAPGQLVARGGQRRVETFVLLNGASRGHRPSPRAWSILRAACHDACPAVFHEANAPPGGLPVPARHA